MSNCVHSRAHPPTLVHARLLDIRWTPTATILLNLTLAPSTVIGPAVRGPGHWGGRTSRWFDARDPTPCSSCSLFPNHSGNAQGVRHKQALHFSTVNHMRVRWLKALAQFSPQYQRTRHKEGVFQIIGPTKRGVEKGVADGIVAAIRQPRAQWIGPKPPKAQARRCGAHPEGLARPPSRALPRHEAARAHRGAVVATAGLPALTLPESDVYHRDERAAARR